MNAKNSGVIVISRLRVSAHSLVEISIALNISESSVQRHIRNIKKKIMKVL